MFCRRATSAMQMEGDLREPAYVRNAVRSVAGDLPPNPPSARLLRNWRSLLHTRVLFQVLRSCSFTVC